MKVKLQIRSMLFILMCGLVTTATTIGYWLISDMPPFYQWSFYVLVIWYAYALYKSTKKKKISIVERNNTIMRNGFFICTMVLMIFMLLLSDTRGLPLELFTFMGCIMFLHISTQISLSELEVNGFFFLGLVGAVLFSMSFAQQAVAWYNSSTLTIPGFNPQSVGCWAGIYFCTVKLAITKFDPPWYLRLAGYAFCGYLFFITLATETRTATIVLVLLFVLMVLPRLKLLLHPIAVAVAAMLPMLVTYISILVYHMGLRDSKGNTVLNGRERLWISYLETADKHPISGNYMFGENGYTHNLYVEHALFFGYILAIVFILLTFWALKRATTYIQTTLQYDAYLAFVGMLLMASQENMVLSTGCGGAFVYAYGFLLLSSQQKGALKMQGDTKRVRKNIWGKKTREEYPS